MSDAFGQCYGMLIDVAQANGGMFPETFDIDRSLYIEMDAEFYRRHEVRLARHFEDGKTRCLFKGVWIGVLDA